MTAPAMECVITTFMCRECEVEYRLTTLDPVRFAEPPCPACEGKGELIYGLSLPLEALSHESQQALLSRLPAKAGGVRRIEGEECSNA